MNQLFEELSVETYARLKRLQWAGHVLRLEDNRVPRKVLNEKTDGRRPVGRPRKRWEDKVREGAHNIVQVEQIDGELQLWRGVWKRRPESEIGL